MRNETILVVEDEKLIRWLLVHTLQELRFDVHEAETIQTGFEKIQEHEIDLIILDQMLPGGSGIELLRKIKEENYPCSVIMLTAVDTSDIAVQAMKLGAYDYLTKPVNIEELKIVLEKALETSRLKRQVAHLLKAQDTTSGFNGIVGASESMQNVFNQISKIALSRTTTVLITGESGTGKELAARAIHQLSERQKNVFMEVNCSALTETLIESELFGHEKGSFTDARTTRKGLFELADEGTVFLDEIGDMPLSIQSKLLRVLEERKFKRVGGMIDIDVDVRIIAATNQKIETQIKENKFRTDLYYRLNVARIHMPPLRERSKDVLLLAEYFLHEFNEKFHKHFKSLSDDTKKLLVQYNWPGNVRELRNVIERATLLDDGDYIFSHEVRLGHVYDLPPEDSHTTNISFGSEGISLSELEKHLIMQALETANSNQSHAAKLLKISRDALRYKMKKYKLMKESD